MSTLISIFYFLVLIFSIIAHEVMHGLIAEREGDSTARILGRITLNPLKHIDWIGSVLLPLVLVLTRAGFVVGWAKPVPYDPRNVRNGRKSVAKIAVSGPLTNLVIAIIFALVIRLFLLIGIQSESPYDILGLIVLVNLVLAVFNSLPLAPLDGFNFLASVLPFRYHRFLRFIERFSLPILIIFLLFGWKFIVPLVYNLFSFMTGVSLANL